MRRIAASIAIPLLAAAVLAGCGSSSGSTPDVSVSGGFGATPKVSIPAQKASRALSVKTLTKGSGPTLTKTDAFLGNYAVYIWSGTSHKLVQSTFSTKSPQLFAGQLLPGLETALIGKKIGSRVLAVIPPAQGYGKNGNPNAGVKGTDTLVFVVDMLKEFAPTVSASGTQVSSGGGALPTVSNVTGKAPTIKIPSGKPPTTLVSKTLIKGSGKPVVKGDTLVVQYVGEIWKSGKVFDASWTRGQPASFPIGVGQVIPGWDKGLVGQTVGSRVLLVIPPADGYGKTGQSQAGITGTDTLVFAVDIVDATGPGQ
jgi:FKBP-type peptidyl-prolyl cis-trans isomerase